MSRASIRILLQFFDAKREKKVLIKPENFSYLLEEDDEKICKGNVNIT